MKRIALLLIAVVALAGRVLFAHAVVFPALDDPAFYVIVARNLAAGRGLVIDALWSYQVLFPAVTHASNEYWMPLASFLMAPFLAAGGGQLWAAHVPGVAAGVALAVLTCVVGWRALPEVPPAVPVVAGLCVALSGTLAYQAASLDSAAIFALAAAGSLAVAARDWSAGSRAGLRPTLAGVLAGLAYLARGDGLLLLPAILLGWWLLGRRALAEYLALGAGFVLVAGPWWARNLLVFGAPLPVPLWKSAFFADYAQTFNFAQQAGPQDLLALGSGAVLELRSQALAVNVVQYLVATFAWGLIAPIGLWLLRRRPLFALSAIYALLLFFVTALVFSVQAQWGMFYHSLGALMPWLALASVYAVERGLASLRRPQYRPLVAAVFLGLALFALERSYAPVAVMHEYWAAQYAQAADWLRANVTPGTVIMTNWPHTLLYASGYPAIPLPAAEPPSATLAAAARYGAQYLLITDSFGLYPQALSPAPPGFTPIYESIDLQVYALAPEAPR